MRSPSRPYACSPGLAVPGAVGRPDAVRASLDATRVTLATRSGGGLAHVLTAGSTLCLVVGPPAPSVIVLAYGGGAHCCDSARGFVASPAGLARPLARIDLADGAALGVANGRVVVRAGKDAFAYTFHNYALSAAPLEL